MKYDNEKDWPHRDITEKIIGAAFEVHNILGSGFLEYVYQEALAYEFKLRGINFVPQKEVNVWYKDFLIPRKYNADFFVEGKVIVEIKALSSLNADHQAQLLHYLKGTKHKVGLLLNFGAASLEIDRKVWGNKSEQSEKSVDSIVYD